MNATKANESPKRKKNFKGEQERKRIMRIMRRKKAANLTLTIINRPTPTNTYLPQTLLPKFRS